jgi:nitrous oxide reductase
MLTRRKFLATAAYAAAAARLSAKGQGKVRIALAIPSEATGPQMPIDFVGLSYEVQQLSDATFFSARNSGLIREFKALSSAGVLRLGGNTSVFAY